MRKPFAVIVGALLAVALVAGPALAKGDRAPGDATIYEIASTTAGFEILTLALETTGLDAALDDGGQFTVFAPTNDAFLALEAANPGILDALVNDPDTLAGVLLYHVTDGRRWSNSLVNRNNPKSVEMLSGGEIVVTPGAMVIDADSLGLGSPDATIVAANINASNGVVHVIDEVLVP